MQVFTRTTFIRTIAMMIIALSSVSYANHESEESMYKRTAPVGHVHIEGTKVVEVKTETPMVATRTGESIYGSLCIACHSIGLANAPKPRDTAAWTTLMERGMDDVLSSAKAGKNAMPPMGTCADCTDEELISAIEHMINLGN
jgi:cytochrome c5